MANITSAMVKELRELTGIGIMECKNALKETDGDMKKAIRFLRERGIIKSAKKSGRETTRCQNSGQKTNKSRHDSGRGAW